MKKKKKMTQSRSFMKSGKLFLTLLFLCTIFLSVGYAGVIGVSLNIEGSASSTLPTELVISNVEYLSNLNGDPQHSTINNYYQTILDSTITLTNDSTSNITYKVTIANYSQETKQYEETIYDTLFYDNEDITYEVEGITTDTILAPKQTITFNITFKFKEVKESYSNLELNSYINFKFKTVNIVAKRGDEYFTTLQGAIPSTTSSDIVEVELINNTQEVVTINSGQKIKILMNGNKIVNDGTKNVFVNNGYLELYNGYIESTTTQGAINNNQNAQLILDGMNISTTGNRQCLYNDKGTATIRGNSILKSTSNQRAAVQNQGSSTLTIISAKITSTNFYGVQNSGNLTIGVQGGEISQAHPEIIGKSYGVYNSSNFYFYDGIIKAQETPILDLSKVKGKEGKEVAIGEETTDGVYYRTAYLADTYKVTFSSDGDALVEKTRNVEKDHKIGKLPNATKEGYALRGWYNEDGTKHYNANDIVYGNITLYAHWQSNAATVLNGQPYSTIQSAINSVPDNTPTEINILKDMNENLTIAENKDITLNLASGTDTYEITNKTTQPVINNYGKLTIKNGIFGSNSSDHSLINNEGGGELIITGGRFVETGSRQVIHNASGAIIRISGDPYIESSTTGKASLSAVLDRATISNVSGGEIYITGGTIVCNTQAAIGNEGLLVIGNKDGTINNTKPLFKGATYAVRNTNTLKIYDGLFKGINGTIDGTVSDTETDSTEVTGTEVLDNKTYHTLYYSN